LHGNGADEALVGRATGMLVHGAVTDRVINAFFRVYNELGTGFLESVYEKALAIQLAELNVPVETQASVVVHFHGKEVGLFRADMIVEGRVLVELKVARSIAEAHEHQVLNFLNATRLEVGLLLNFGPRAEFKRLLLTNNKKKSLSVPFP
jgi:GxxExxY protein